MNISYIFQDSIEKQKQKDLDLSRERFKELACVIMEAGDLKFCREGLQAGDQEG